MIDRANLALLNSSVTTAMKRKFLTLLSLVWLAGCVTPHPDASPDLMNFLQNGQTTREEVMLKLGQPSGVFEQEKILTYRLGQNGERGYYVITPKAMRPWQEVRYSLVLVFDPKGILQKQSLVAVD